MLKRDQDEGMFERRGQGAGASKSERLRSECHGPRASVRAVACAILRRLSVATSGALHMSKRYRVAAIGTAWAAQSPLPALSSHPRTELVAICSARLPRAKEAAEKFGAPHAFDDHEK